MPQYSNNPRENFLIDMMERQKNRTTPITVEDFLKQMGGLSSLGVTAEQLQQKFDQNATGNDHLSHAAIFLLMSLYYPTIAIL